MDVLPLHFRTLRFFGVWHETQQHWLVKYLWRPFFVNVTVIFTLSQLAALSIYRDNVKDLTECIFLSLTYLGLCLRLLNFTWRRDAMDSLLKDFRVDVFQPRNAREREITAEYEKIISMVFYSYMAIAQLSGFAFYFLPLVSMAAGNTEIFLPYKTYEIYDRKNLVYYWVTYVYQVFAIVTGIVVNITLDSMLGSFILLICCQIDLCCHRFAASGNGQIRRSTRELVKHQIFIRTVVRKLESFFMSVVVPLMLLGLITLCTSIYNMSKIEIGDVELLLPYFIYLGALFYLLLCNCWIGNVLLLKSTAIRETIYNGNWTELMPLDRRSLCLVMLSCENEMSLSFHGVCKISLEIFVWVVNTAYAAFNLLKNVDSRYE